MVPKTAGMCAKSQNSISVSVWCTFRFSRLTATDVTRLAGGQRNRTPAAVGAVAQGLSHDATLRD